MSLLVNYVEIFSNKIQNENINIFYLWFEINSFKIHTTEFFHLCISNKWKIFRYYEIKIHE